jgi:hypothetical protein
MAVLSNPKAKSYWQEKSGRIITIPLEAFRLIIH